MRIGVPKERLPGETRVALVPQVVARLVKKGIEVAIEAGAGEAALFPDDAFRAAGAAIAPDAAALYAGADVVLKVRRPARIEALGSHEADLVREGAALVCLLFPRDDADAVHRLARRKVSAFALELIPRITRAQRMDVLSAMSTLAGYKAALIAADSLRKIFPMLITAAGTIAPARVIVLGAGVAGLQAIATAKRLGAVVEAFDVRPAVKEQVESLGAKFVGIDLDKDKAEDGGGYAKALERQAAERQQELIHEHLRRSDAVISTALIPFRPAPILVTEAMVKDMREGSVIVDLAAERGGNCELAEPDRTVTRHGVIIHGPTNLPAALPVHASEMFARNLLSLVIEFHKEGELRLPPDDEIVRGALVTRAGEIVHPATREALAEEAAS